MKPLRLSRDRLFCCLILVFSVLLDQWTKHLAVLHLRPIRTLPLWEGVFHLTYCTNTGAAFSMFAAPDQRWIFLSVSSVAICCMLVFLFLSRELSPAYRYSLAMIAGGGIGNMIDRLSTGAVVDFFDFRLINFAIFNVADCFVTVGACLLFLTLVLDWWGEARKARAAAGEGATQKEDGRDGNGT